MKFEELARDSGRALADAAAQLPPPSLTEISSRRRRTTLAAGAVGVAALLLGAGAVASSINRAGPAVSPPTSDSPASTMVAEVAPVTVVDLLDGSRLEVIGADLELTGYLFFLEGPELGGSTNVYLSPVDDPAEAAATESAELEADLGGGVQLWRGDRQGQPLFMSVDLDGWIVFLHVGSDAPPNSEDLLALAEELRGEVTEQGVIMPNHDTDAFTTYLGSPGSENSIHLGIGECLREVIPGSEIVEHPARGEVIQGDAYASWCDDANDLEVRVHGDAGFVIHNVGGLTLRRSYPESQPTTTSTSTPPTTPTTTLSIPPSTLQDSDAAAALAIPSPSECGQAPVPMAVTVGGNLHRSAVGASSIWVSDWNTGRLTQLDASTLCTRAQLTIGEPFSSVIDLVADGDSLWVADFSTGSVHKVSGQGTVSRTIPDVRAGAGMVIEGTNLYAICCGIGEGVGDDPITRINTTNGEASVIARVDWPSAAAYGHESLWVGSYIANRVARLDPTTGDQIAEIELPEGIISDIAVTNDSIWVASATSLIQIDPSSNLVIDALDVPGAEIPGNVQIEERADGLLWIYGRHFQPFLLQPSTRTTIARMEAPPDSVNSTEQGLSLNSTDRGIVITDGGTVAILNDH